jgi:membrane-bound inhibitor of C-type lysozyme
MFKSSTAATLFIIMLTVSLCACATNPQKEIPTVEIGPPVTYESADGDRFLARYGSLSDGTLDFVKLKMPNGREYTLPQAVSGSGARYTDDREIVWWEHRGTVRVDVRGAGGKWVTQYSDLKVVHGK